MTALLGMCLAVICYDVTHVWCWLRFRSDTPVLVMAFALLTLFGLLTFVGIAESAMVALVILITHIFTLLLLSVCSWVHVSPAHSNSCSRSCCC